MNNIHKTILYWSSTVLIVVLIIFLLASIEQKVNTATTTNTVSFSGEGKVLAKPDVAVAYLSIVTEAVTSKAAQDENSRKSQDVVNFLKKQGVDEKDIKTSSYNIYPQYNYPRFDRPEIKGYQVNQSLEVKIRDLDKASDILDGMVGAGVNQVGSFNFQIDNPEKLKAEARQLAIEDAKGKANELKDQLGIRLGRIINFTENTFGYPIPLYERALPADAGGGIGGGPSLPTGENEVTVNVTITYQIR